MWILSITGRLMGEEISALHPTFTAAISWLKKRNGIYDDVHGFAFS